MGSVTELGQLVGHHELAFLEDLVVQEPAAIRDRQDLPVDPRRLSGRRLSQVLAHHRDDQAMVGDLWQTGHHDDADGAH